MSAESRPDTDDRHPILVAHINGADGSDRRQLRVYCAARAGTVSLDICRECAGCRSIHCDEQSSDAWIECSPPPDQEALPPDLSVGDALKEGVVAVEDDVLIRDVVALFAARRLRLIVVVDANGRAVGVLHESHLLPQIQALSHAKSVPVSAHLGWAEVANSKASELMSAAVSVSETISLRQALTEMAAARQQRMVAVDQEGIPVGVLVDAHAMHMLRANRD